MGLFDKFTKDSSQTSDEPSLVRHFSDEDLDKHLETDKGPVMVDFWAPWCAPCRMIAPVLEKIAVDFEENAVIAKINVDEHQEWASKLGVRGIPTIAIFNDGKAINQLVGMRAEPELRAALEELMPESE